MTEGDFTYNDEIYKLTIPTSVINAKVLQWVTCNAQGNNVNLEIGLRIDTYAGGAVTYYPLQSLPFSGTLLQTLLFNSPDQPIAINIYDQVYMYYKVTGTIAAGSNVFLNFSSNTNGLVLTTLLPSPTSLVKGYRYGQVWSKIIAKIGADLQYSSLGSASTFLNNAALDPSKYFGYIPYNTLITSGDALRGFTDAALYISLDDLFKDCSSRWEIGLGISPGTGNTGIARIEDIGFYMDTTTNLGTLAAIKPPTFDFTTEWMGNSIKLGQSTQTYSDINGLDEFNNEQTRTLSIKPNTISNELDYSSPWRKDMYGIEIARLRITEKVTTDSKNDNDTFVIALTSILGYSGYYELDRQQDLTLTTGVYFPSAIYNVALSPVRDLYRHGRWLRSAMGASNLNPINTVHQTTDKNDALVSRLSYDPAGFTVVEKANIGIQDLSPLSLFKPVVMTVEVAVPPGFGAAQPNGYYNVVWQGNTYKGFVMDASESVAKRGSQTWKLLLTPNSYYF